MSAMNCVWKKSSFVSCQCPILLVQKTDDVTAFAFQILRDSDKSDKQPLVLLLTTMDNLELVNLKSMC